MQILTRMIEAATKGHMWRAEFARNDKKALEPVLFKELSMARNAKSPDAKSPYKRARGPEVDFFLKLAEKAQVFVVSVTDEINRKLFRATPNFQGGEPLDLPFQTCYFEPLPDAKGCTAMTMVFDDGPESLGQASLAMLVHETAPRVYDIYSYQLFQPPKELNMDWYACLLYYPNLHGVESVAAIQCHRWLHLLNNGVWGVETLKSKPHPKGSRSERKKVAVRRIIRIVSKGERESTAPAFSKEIDWSHRWTVRGHWRKNDGLGKDREGNYCVTGHTWVVDHVKGPEDAQLIPKVRVYGPKEEK